MCQGKSPEEALDLDYYMNSSAREQLPDDIAKYVYTNDFDAMQWLRGIFERLMPICKDPVRESALKGTGRVDFDDDLVAVYDTKGKLEYKGLFDDCPYKDEPMQYDRKNMVYRFEAENGDYRTMVKLSESCKESSRFGFNDYAESTIKGKGRIKYEDDLVVVYSPDGKVDYEGMFDYCPYRYDSLDYDKATKSYRIYDPKSGDCRIMVKVESCHESSRFGFEVGDKVVLTKDKSNRFSGDFICAGTEGEVVAINKPMPGIIKVKIEDWKVISVPERQLRKADEDEEPWKKMKKPPEPKRDVRPERPEDYYMRPTSYGSPRFTGD